MTVEKIGSLARLWPLCPLKDVRVQIPSVTPRRITMFIAYVKQKGEGCDYTVACGETVWRLKAETYEDAMEELKDKVIGKMETSDCEYHEGYWSDSTLDCITLFEVSSEIQIPVDTWYVDALERAEAAKAEIKEKAERNEFERLKEKYS